MPEEHSYQILLPFQVKKLLRVQETNPEDIIKVQNVIHEKPYICKPTNKKSSPAK